LITWILIVGLLSISGHTNKLNASNPETGFLSDPNFAFSYLTIVNCELSHVDSPYAITEIDAELCLVDTFPTDFNVYLVKKDATGIVTTNTGVTKESYFEHTGSIQTTAIEYEITDDIWQFCDAFSVAIISTESLNVRCVIPEVYDNPEYIYELDKRVRSAGLFESFPGYSSEFQVDLSYAYILPYPENYIMITYTYNNQWTTEYHGPRFLIIEDDIYPLTGFYSADYITFFKIGSNLFAASLSGVPNCGYVWWEVFETKDSGVRVIDVNHFPGT